MLKIHTEFLQYLFPFHTKYEDCKMYHESKLSINRRNYIFLYIVLQYCLYSVIKVAVETELLNTYLSFHLYFL